MRSQAAHSENTVQPLTGRAQSATSFHQNKKKLDRGILAGCFRVPGRGGLYAAQLFGSVHEAVGNACGPCTCARVNVEFTCHIRNDYQDLGNSD